MENLFTFLSIETSEKFPFLCHSERSEESKTLKYKEEYFFITLRKPIYQVFQLIIFLLLLLINDTLIADNSYPNSYSEYELHDGGRLIITKPSYDWEQPFSFFIKPSWPGESELLLVWRGLQRNKVIGSPVRGVHFLSAKPLENTILTVWEENSRIFIEHIDSLAESISIFELYDFENTYTPNEVNWLGKCSENSYLLIINKKLFVVSVETSGILKVQSVASNVQQAVSMYKQQSKNPYIFSYLQSLEGWDVVYLVDSSGNEQVAARLQLPDIVSLFPIGNQVAIVSSTKFSYHSLIQIIDSHHGEISNSLIQAKCGLIRINVDKSRKNVYFLQNLNNVYSLNSTEYSTLKNQAKWTETQVPREFIEPMGLWLESNTLFLLYRNGLVTFDLEGKLLSADFFPFGELFSSIPELTVYNDYLILSSQTASLILERNEHQFWILNRFLKNWAKILFPAILIIILIITFQFLRHQKRLLDTVLGLPTSGVVFIIDKKGRLLRANESGKKLLGITDSIPMRRQFRYYCDFESMHTFLDFFEKAITMRSSLKQKINIVEKDTAKEWYCTITPMRNIAGQFRGLIFTGIDITEELERKRLHNWAQLAHDMQTNLTTIRLNAEQLDVETAPENLERRKKIIHQVVLLIQRVRDIVTVGRSNDLEKQLISASDICREVRREFDEIVFPNVQFELNTTNFMVSCDKPKILRALRNAVENGIRSLPDKTGKIIISCTSDRRYAYFRVKDNGSGMDEKTKAKMLTPYFTTAKETGGTGIGTMIMQHVIELHGGELNIISEKGKGTEIVFILPNLVQDRKKKFNIK